MSESYALVIQCEESHRRCSGYACSASYYDRTGRFADREAEERYISMGCGGCPGKGLAAKLEHFAKKIRTRESLKKEAVTVYLASCMCTDNHHYDRCPHLDYIKALVRKKGFERIVEGTYISERAEKKRQDGIYKSYD